MSSLKDIPCSICNRSYPDTDVIDMDTGKHAHIPCFFGAQKQLNCKSDPYGEGYIRQNPLNKKWYIYNLENEYKHSSGNIDYCPFCGELLSSHDPIEIVIDRK